MGRLGNGLAGGSEGDAFGLGLEVANISRGDLEVAFCSLRAASAAKLGSGVAHLLTFSPKTPFVFPELELLR